METGLEKIKMPSLIKLCSFAPVTSDGVSQLRLLSMVRATYPHSPSE